MATYLNKIHKVLAPLIGEDAKVALFDFPNHSNVGDSAIWIGEEYYLKSKLNVRIGAVDVATTSNYALPKLSTSTIILLHGGGNFGDLYPRHQRFREFIISNYKENRIIQLPQSIYFESCEEMKQCSEIIASHPDFHLLVRDQKSFELGAMLHSGTTKLCPDMALSLGHLKPTKVPKHPIFGLLRTDKESILSSKANSNDVLFLPQSDWLKESASTFSIALLPDLLCPA